MKIYYVALTTDKDTVAKNYSGKRLSLYTKKHEAIKTCVLLNYQWELFFGNGAKEEKPFKVYCVESEFTKEEIKAIDERYLEFIEEV